MGLVYRNQGNRRLHRKAAEIRCGQSLRRHIENSIGAAGRAAEHRLILGIGEGGIDVCRRNSYLSQGGHLVLHQGNQW